MSGGVTREHIASTFSGRHPATIQILQHFASAHLPPQLQAVSWPCGDLAMRMALALPDSPELTAGLRKLLEAKDCFVRAEIEGGQT